jgi:transposase
MPRFRAMTTLVDTLVPDELWAMVEPCCHRHLAHGGVAAPRTIPDRNCFAAIVYMARTSTPWRLLPARELGCGSPATGWRRLDEWAKAGVFEALHVEVLNRSSVSARSRSALRPLRTSAGSDSVHAA